MAGYYWIKLFLEILDDSKMAILPDRLWRRVIELFLFAGEYHKDGALPDTAQIAWRLRMPLDELDLDLRQIEPTKIIRRTDTGWLIPKFAERQKKMSPAEKMQLYRDKQRKAQYYQEDEDDVTLSNSTVTQINRLTDNRLTDIDAEQSISTPFDKTREFIESLTGLPAMPQSIQAINEIIQLGCTQEDITAGYKWYQENVNKPLKYYGQLVGPARTAMAQRLRANNTPQQQEQSILDQVVAEALNARKREKTYF